MVLDTGVFSLIIAVVSAVVVMTIFWFKMSTSLKSILHKVGAMMVKQFDSEEKNDLFKQKIENNIETFKNDSSRQQHLCSSHAEGLSKVLSGQRAQGIQQDNMKSLFDDIKNLTTSTNSAIQNNTAVLTELLIIIKERKHI